MDLDVSENIKKYVKMGIGISILTSLTLTSQDKKKFFLFNVSHLFNKMDYGIYYRKDKHVSTSMKQFIKFLSPELILL